MTWLPVDSNVSSAAKFTCFKNDLDFTIYAKGYLNSFVCYCAMLMLLKNSLAVRPYAIVRFCCFIALVHMHCQFMWRLHADRLTLTFLQ